MDLMQRDPDQGLKFALPMTNLPGRGVAPPSNRLGARDVNFNLKSALNAGQSADRWDVPDRMRDTLRAGTGTLPTAN